MKFETNNYETVKKHQKKIRKDSCTHQDEQSVNVRAHVLSRRNARAHVYAFVCMPVCTELYEKSLDNSLLSYEFKSQIS